MTLLLACAAFVAAWLLASGVLAVTVGRILHRADVAQAGRPGRVPPLS